MLRKEENMTQEQLAEKVGVSTRMVRAFESGESGASIDVLIELSELFDISTDYLLKGKLTLTDAKIKLLPLLAEVQSIVEKM